MNLRFFTHSSPDGRLGRFQISATVNNAAMNIEVHIFFRIGVFGFLGYIPRSGVAGSKGTSIFNFWKKLHFFLHREMQEMINVKKYILESTTLHDRAESRPLPDQLLCSELFHCAVLTPQGGGSPDPRLSKLIFPKMS